MRERNCIIIHGCPADVDAERHPGTRSFDKHWIAWLRERLIERSIPTSVPIMPAPWAPDYASYKEEFARHPVSDRTILIGHSCGCAFLVRWLGETQQAIDTLVLVAPWKIPRAGDLGRKAFYEFPVDPTIKQRLRRIVMFTSDTERDDGKRSLEIYRAALGGDVVSLPSRGHYVRSDMGTDEFPELLDLLSV